MLRSLSPTTAINSRDRATGLNEPEGTIFTNYVTQRGSYPDGSTFELLWPTVNIRDRNHGPLTEGTQVSARIGAQLIGMGLIEAIPDDTILALTDPNDANGDSVSGRPNFVWNPATQQTELGRFGWKSNVVQLDQEIAQAFHGDLGVTSTLIDFENCAQDQDVCDKTPNGGTHEVSNKRLDAITLYLGLLAVPPARTDEDPAAHRPDVAASGVEWRTAPLWGLGLVPVDDDRGLLHDGRARTLEEAIIWHGGEAARSRGLFMRAELSDRLALLAFLESL